MRKAHKQLLLISSAVVYASAFIWPKICSFFVVIFLIPIFYYALKKQLNFKDGVLWGLFFFTIHLSEIIIVLYQRGEGGFRIVVAITLIIYYSVHVGIWFYVLNKFPITRILVFQPCMVALTTYLYFFWLIYISLWPSGVLMGYCFGWPLLPLAVYPKCLYLSGRVGWHFFLLCLILTQYFFAVAFSKKKTELLYCSLFCVSPFLIGQLLGTRSNKIFAKKLPHACSYIAPIDGSCIDQIEHIIQSAVNTLRNQPYKTILLMPESTLKIPLHEAEFQETLQAQIQDFDKDFYIIIGAPRTDNNIKYNSLYCLHRSRIIFYYDKSILMPFVERIPTMWKNNDYFNNLFLKNKDEYSPTKEPIKPCNIDTLALQPCICSELFYSSPNSLKNNNATTLLALVNDSWFTLAYMRTLMRLYACYLSLLIQKDIIYVGHKDAFWINHETGKPIPIT